MRVDVALTMSRFTLSFSVRGPWIISKVFPIMSSRDMPHTPNHAELTSTTGYGGVPVCQQSNGVSTGYTPTVKHPNNVEELSRTSKKNCRAVGWQN